MSTDTAPKHSDEVPAGEDLESLLAEGRRRTRKTGPRGPRKMKATALAAKIASGVNLIAAGVTTVDEFDGAVIAANADKLGKAWAPVIEANPRIAAFFAQLEKGGIWGAAIIATAGVVLPILVRHMGEELPPPVRALGAMLTPPEVIAQFHARQQAQAQYGHAGAANNGAAPS